MSAVRTRRTRPQASRRSGGAPVEAGAPFAWCYAATGSSSAAVLTAGAIIAPVLALIGLPRATAGAFIAMAGILGMIAPPVNIPAMIIGGGIDMPYVGFEIPLLLLTLPLALFSALFYGLPHARRLDLEQVRGVIDAALVEHYGWRLYLPVVLAVALMAAGAKPSNSSS